MQEFNDGTFGPIKTIEELKDAFSQPEELARTKAIHFGTEEQLQKIKDLGEKINAGEGMGVKEYLRVIDDKLDMIIKHFKIVRIIGQ